VVSFAKAETFAGGRRPRDSAIFRRVSLIVQVSSIGTNVANFFTVEGFALVLNLHCVLSTKD
jgi:hypothetical protein